MLKLQDRPVAARYARALFDAAVTQKAVEPVRRDLSRLRELLVTTPALDDVLRHPRVPLDAKRAVLQKAIGPCSIIVERLIGILLEKKRWDAFQEILPVYERLADGAGGILAVQAETAVRLSEEETAHVQRSLEKKWGGPVSLKTRVREDLLGGVVLRVGDQVWDNSFKGQLERLREVWLAGTARS